MKSIALLVLAAPLFAANPTVEIKVDQVGYLPTAAKIALVVSKNPATEFTLNTSKDGKVAAHGTLSAPRDDFDSGDRVQMADFSKWIKPGQYYIDVPGVGRSWNFDIAPDVYAKAWRLAMRSYYGQRCGIAVDLGPNFPAINTLPATWKAPTTPPRAKPDRSPLPAAGTMPAITAGTW